MPHDLSSFSGQAEKIIEWFSRELLGIRTGRATPAILDAVRVDSYGAKVSVNHIAGITMEDAKTLCVVPWDKNQISEVEKAITDANLGVSVNSDKEGIRVILPELTLERREALQKVVNAKHEEARVSLRTARDDTWNDVQKQEKSGEISNDEKFNLKEKLQELVEKTNKKLDEMAKRKENEISA